MPTYLCIWALLTLSSLFLVLQTCFYVWADTHTPLDLVPIVFPPDPSLDSVLNPHVCYFFFASNPVQTSNPINFNPINNYQTTLSIHLTHMTLSPRTKQPLSRGQRKVLEIELGWSGITQS